ncbi:glucosaminidase domain-containing protein [Cohnella panacarvi]|uniref:glucosaminidase domain-containing protein n=1 Tax=Cohnella panacarvi TaxID=400776 RepID=UPI0009FD9842|nr:glucosaminidase domain-containing protein [Cohnella panacarvi]
MHREHRQWLAYFLSGIVLLCLGFYLVSSIFNHASAASGPQPKASAITGAIDRTSIPNAYMSLPNVHLPSAVAESSPITIPPQPPQSPAPTASTAVSQPPSQPAIREDVKMHTYEITAYYLNVRDQPDPKAKILNVLAQGTIIEALLQTDNRWLKLKDGGYVHGGYAKPLKDDIVKIASLSSENNAVIESEENDLEERVSEPSKPTSSVKSESGLSEDDISEILEGTDLADHGLEEAILDIEEEYGINAYFTIAVMKLESGNGESRIAKIKNNLFGLNAIAGDAFNKALSFETKADCVRMFGQLIAEKYVDKGYTTVERINKKYCPANSKWSSHVKNIMARDYRSL